MTIEKVMSRFYKKANGNPLKLPWYQKQPADFVRDFLPGGKGKSLDVGCGSGEHSIWLSGLGFDVVGIDMFQEAISMAKQQAQDNMVQADFEMTDLFSYEPANQFDLVYDSGCLHSLVGGDRNSYKQKIMEWTKPNGTFLLMHWGKRNRWDWRPIGPKRKSKESIVALFEPEFTLEKYNHHDFKADFPFGPVVRGMCFKFVKK